MREWCVIVSTSSVSANIWIVRVKTEMFWGSADRGAMSDFAFCSGLATVLQWIHPVLLAVLHWVEFLQVHWLARNRCSRTEVCLSLLTSFFQHTSLYQNSFQACTIISASWYRRFKSLQYKEGKSVNYSFQLAPCKVASDWRYSNNRSKCTLYYISLLCLDYRLLVLLRIPDLSFTT